MIDMLSFVKEDFPGLFTRNGKLTKRIPERFKCECGREFSKMKQVFSGFGLKFASPLCTNCGKKGKKNVAYQVWKRMEHNQVEQEDFILNLVKDKGTCTKEEVYRSLKSRFETETKALSTLVYYGYLKVDAEKRDQIQIIEYSLNEKKDFNKRYELF